MFDPGITSTVRVECSEWTWHGRRCSVAACAFELILFVGEQHVEARERPVTSADVRLELHLRILREIGRVDVLLERAQPVSEHHDLVEERLDRPGLLLQARPARTQDQRTAPPLFRRRGGRHARLLANDPPQQQLEIRTGVGQHDRWRAPFRFGDDRKCVALRGLASRFSRARGTRHRRDDARAPSIVVFAATVPAGHAQRATLRIGSDHRVHTIRLANTAEVLERLTGPERTLRHDGYDGTPEAGESGVRPKSAT
jgi:hypothetical protein